MSINTNLAYLHDDYEEFFETSRLTKKQRRALRKKQNTGLRLRHIDPRTPNQIRTFEKYDKGDHLLLQGVAGTGKTFISSYLALDEILHQRSSKQKLVIVRSVVPTRDMGFLPGNQKEKQKAYELPYQSIFTELFNRGDAYDTLKGRGMVDFISTSFIRGITINSSIVLVDECQNLTFHELDSIITRVGEDCRIIFSGDFRQTDLERDYEKRGLIDFMKVISGISGFSSVQFEEGDIVRSQLVRDYIISKLNHGIYT
jgi:phosphate starvation-inducible protein PhoH